MPYSLCMKYTPPVPDFHIKMTMMVLLWKETTVGCCLCEWSIHATTFFSQCYLNIYSSWDFQCQKSKETQKKVTAVPTTLFRVLGPWHMQLQTPQRWMTHIPSGKYNHSVDRETHLSSTLLITLVMMMIVVSPVVMTAMSSYTMYTISIVTWCFFPSPLCFQGWHLWRRLHQHLWLQGPWWVLCTTKQAHCTGHNCQHYWHWRRNRSSGGTATHNGI